VAVARADATIDPVSRQRSLHLLPEIVIDDRLVLARIGLVLMHNLAAIDAILRDTFVFFLAGHGKTIDGRYYFVPQDFRYEGEESIVKKGVDHLEIVWPVSQVSAGIR
jgi:hypothetical protein